MKDINIKKENPMKKMNDMRPILLKYTDFID